MNALILLQNAWSPMYSGTFWPRKSWLRALHKSRTGIRLKVLTEVAKEVTFDYNNTTPEVSSHPDGVCLPDAEHMKQIMFYDNFRPDLVIACGRQAAMAMELVDWKKPLLIVPHPAYRLVTDILFRRAGEIVAAGFTGQRELRQGHKKIEEITRV